MMSWPFLLTNLRCSLMNLCKPVALVRPLALCFAMLMAGSDSSAGVIREVLEPPDTPGNAYTGTFFITPSEPVWAFGVGNELIQDTSISGISFIDGQKASNHWVSSLISQTSWNDGYDFNRVRPFGATGSSSFSIDTSSTPWQWGSTEYVAFYWLAEAGDLPSPVAVLQPDTEYDAFKFFTSGPNSPFAAFSAADGGNITTGETIVEGIDGTVPEPASLAIFALAGLGMAGVGARRRLKRS